MSEQASAAHSESLADELRHTPRDGFRLARFETRLPDLRYLALFIAAYVVALFTSEHLYGTLGVPSPFWFPDSVLLCALFLNKRPTWWVFILAIWPIRLLMGGVPGTPAWFVVFGILNDSLKAFVAAWWLEKLLARPVRLITPREFGYFVAIATAIVPLLSALAAAPARHVLGEPLWSAGYRWLLGNALTQIVVTPTLLWWCTSYWRRISLNATELALLSTGLLAVLYYAFVVPHVPTSPVVLYMPVPFLIWAAVRFGGFGAANALTLVAIVAMVGAVRGTGVFAGGEPRENVLAIQLFLLVLTISLLSLAILQAAIESKTRELDTLLEAAPIAILIADDARGKSVRANRSADPLHAALMQASGAQSASGLRGLVRNGEDVRPEAMPLQQALSSGRAVHGEEFTIVLGDGRERDLIGSATPLLDDANNPRGAVAAFLDITDRRTTERALRESEERFRLISDTAPVLIWMSGRDKKCSFFNKGWLDFTGRSLEEELEVGWAVSVHPDDREETVHHYVTCFDRRESFTSEYRLRRHDGEYRWVADAGVPCVMRDGTFTGYIGSVIDITDRKIAELELQELSGRLIDAQEHERARIARELHDDFGQRLAVVQMTLAQLANQTTGLPPKRVRQLATVNNEVAEICKTIHDLSHQLHPATLGMVGLVSALEGLCGELQMQHGVRVHFLHGDLPDVSMDVRVCIYRVAQEALRNVIKHSGAAHAMMELTADSQQVEMRISDDGAGFLPESAESKAGLGLVSMRERLRVLGGQLTLESAPAEGTHLYITVPHGMTLEGG